jgi:hypothetical protein
MVAVVAAATVANPAGKYINRPPVTDTGGLPFLFAKIPVCSPDRSSCC